MKQHITKAQLKELTKEQKAKLVEWCKKYPSFPHTTVTYKADGTTNIKTDFDHNWLLDIGQMIEYLDVHSFEPEIERWDIKATWIVGYPHPKRQFECTELADALWEAVKSTL